jgi:hypothetical protein
MQRRISSLGQKTVSAALNCSRVGDSRYVLASRHGDLGRTVGLLRSLALMEPLSPTDFSMSVHHALAGVISIHTGNREGHTAVAAADDTFGFGFLEAASYVAAESEPALLLFCDDPLPAEYEEFETPDGALPLVVVAQLEPSSGDGSDCVFAPTVRDRSQSRNRTRATQAPFEFIRFLLSGDTSVVSAGQRMDWRWSRA